jgi:putative membrane protein
MLWVKAVHIIFVVAWFAGLFYLPRLFVYHVDTLDDAGHQRFVLMERKLYGLMTIAMIGTWVAGITMIVMVPGYLHLGWLHAKLTLVILLTGYQGWLKMNLRRFASKTNTRSARFWRFMNEVPALLLIAIVILVVVKPF